MIRSVNIMKKGNKKLHKKPEKDNIFLQAKKWVKDIVRHKVLQQTKAKHLFKVKVMVRDKVHQQTKAKHLFKVMVMGMDMDWVT